MSANQDSDFTEARYRSLIVKAKKGWRFISFSEHETDGRAVLWRHDVDVSVHRAYRLAQIEQEEGVASTFFLMLHSPFYNLLEASVSKLVFSIAEMGHRLGLHFDPSYYGKKINTEEFLLQKIETEKSILEDIGCDPIESISWHNPTMGNWLSMNDDYYAGMVNAYGSKLNRDYKYVSDSNGYWRHEPLGEILEEAKVKKIQVLTHPEWWQEHLMYPRTRIFRSVYGRASSVLKSYDALLDANSRENLAGLASHLRFLKAVQPNQFELCDYLWNVSAFPSLLVELYTMHQRQMFSLGKSAICKFWRVPESDADALLSAQSELDGRLLFELVFELSWSEVCGEKASELEDCSTTCQAILFGHCTKPLTLVEERCVMLCKWLARFIRWGNENSGLNHDGLSAEFEKRSDSAEPIKDPDSRMWDEFKERLASTRKG